MAELVYEKLSYQLVGLAYEVFRRLGAGLKEKTYADAYEATLKRDGIEYRREVYNSLKIGESTVGKKFFDFCIENKIILEFKVGSFKYYDAFNQLLDYLKVSKLKLGMIIRFTSEGVKVKRIPNII